MNDYDPLRDYLKRQTLIALSGGHADKFQRGDKSRRSVGRSFILERLTSCPSGDMRVVKTKLG